MSFVLLCPQITLAQADPDSTGEPPHLTEEILRLENIRLSNHNEFIAGLDLLENKLSQMSAYQVCHYQFLRAYQTAFAGESLQAVSDLEKIIPLCDDLRARIRIDALISNISAISGDYKKASYHVDNAIQNAEQTVDKKSKLIAYSGASVVYNLLDQKELSVKYSELHYNLEPNDENLCRVQYSKNMYHLDGDQDAPDLETILEIAKNCKESGNALYAQSIVLDNIKRTLSSGGMAAGEMAYIADLVESMKAEIDATPYKNIKVNFKAIEAKIAYLVGDYEEAMVHGEKTISLNENLGYTEQLIMALEVLENISKSRGDFVKSYDYLNRKNEAELKMYDQSQAKQMAFMTVKHSNLAKVFEIEQLNRQKEVLELEKKLAKQETNNQRLVILLILTLLGFMALWLVRIKKKHDYFKGVSEIDHLTKVLTRKAFEEQVKVQLNYCQDHKLPIQMAIMDLDHFKKVNDTHGHLIGDWVLKNVVYAIKEFVEEDMILARLGGEEFCIVFPKVECDVMEAKLEQMRSAVETLDCDESGAELSVTASFGYTSSITSGYSLPLLLTHADVALFEAKKQGRNQVIKFKTIQRVNKD